MTKPRPSSSAGKAPSAEPVTLTHCEPGDPCERELTLHPDGTVTFSALCAEMLPVARALTPDLPPIQD